MKPRTEWLKPVDQDSVARSDNPFRLTKIMIDDFRADPVLAARWILGMELPPHQRLRLRDMWRKKFFIDDSGISTGKDATAAMCASLRCILFPDWIATFLAKGVRQLENIKNEYFVKWRANRPFFANEIQNIYRPNNVITVEFRNGSVIKLMASGWDRDAETLRSERWNEVYMNEWHTYGNLEAIQKTAFGRVTRYHPGKDVEEYKEICGAHITLMSSAGFKWQPEYKLVEDWQKKIDNGNPLYARQRWDYYDIPKRMRSLFTDEDIMKEMFDSLPIENALVEIMGVWEHSSADFYNQMFINECRENGVPVMTCRVDDGYYYVAGVDIAKNRDDFSVVVIRFRQNKKPEVVYCFRGNGLKTWAMSGIIHHLRSMFSLSFILMDAGGGGLYVKEELEKPEQIIRGKPVQCGPILTRRDIPILGAHPILELFKCSHEYHSVYKYFAVNHPGAHHDDGILDAAHTILRSAIENAEIAFPTTGAYTMDEREIRACAKFGKTEREAQVEKRVTCENIDNMLSELVGVKRKTNPDGSFYVTSRGFYSWTSLKKKDSAYGLLYAYVAYRIFVHEHFDMPDDDEMPVIADEMYSENEEDPFDEDHEDGILYGDYE